MRYRIDLKKEREKRGLTQAQLADRIGVTEKSISKWESGRGQPSYDNMLKICKVYNLNINKIDSTKISKRRVNVVLNSCLISINALIAIIVIFQVIIKYNDAVTVGLNSSMLVHHFQYETTRFKLWLLWFIFIPTINLFVPIVFRKNIVVSSCIALLSALLSLLVFKDFYSKLINNTIIIGMLGILMIQFINYKCNRKYKGEIA
ncbi:MAG: helix-turn-helix transcriptional regulator [Erysipelotrichales bacterium]|nr:helix-turn-helix transcriptional regulator [Erysipelotrichales bacterium]